jgi:glutaminase
VEVDVEGVNQAVSTGNLPDPQRVIELAEAALGRYREREDGAVADYIPILAQADPDWFGIAITGAAGRTFAAGDDDVAFSIQSISKPFVYALVCDALGHHLVRDRVGVNNTGLPFNSVMAIELNAGHPMNPLVNAGAMATTALIPGATPADRWEYLRQGLSRFAGHPLELDDVVYRSESETNIRNRAIARLLQSYDQIQGDPLEAVDVYTRQCSLRVTVTDLAVMGSTLACGGVNPVTGERVIDPEVCRDTLSVMTTAGMYERSGEWLFEIGLPAKSGVSGGIVAVAPGKGSVATFSPRLDEAGNSVRGQLAIGYLSRTLGLNMFASAPVR